MDRISHQDRSFARAGDGRDHAMVAAMIERPVPTICIMLMMLFAVFNRTSAQPPDIKTQGPWAYARQIEPASEAVLDMATTAAIDDGNVWLLLACNEDRELTVSIMHVTEFSYPVDSQVNISLRIDDHPKLTMPAVSIHNEQVSLASRSSHDLLPLLLSGTQSFVTIPDGRGEPHEYGFNLQPNNIALSRIRANCLDRSDQ
jgi:hypothetical protein